MGKADIQSRIHPKDGCLIPHVQTRLLCSIYMYSNDMYMYNPCLIKLTAIKALCYAETTLQYYRCVTADGLSHIFYNRCSYIHCTICS